MEGREAETVSRLLPVILGFSSIGIAVGGDSVGVLRSLHTLEQQQPEKQAILQNPLGLLHLDY